MNRLHKILVFAASAALVAGCSWFASGPDQNSIRLNFVENIVVCDAGNKNFTISEDDIDMIPDFFDGSGAAALRVHYQNTKDFSNGYIDVQRKERDETYLFKAEFDKKAPRGSKCSSLKSWGKLDPFGRFTKE
ncbi:MAG: hypothetical protein GY866_07035 [Proteobacteria bacterium]|nr:hypothetical protein [Pseudomonadota bacterium]